MVLTFILLFSIGLVDAWAKSGEGVSAAQRAEEILQEMNRIYQQTGQENLRPTTGIFNAVINAWARSRDKMAPSRAEQILQWMHTLHETNPTIQPDKYTFNTGANRFCRLLSCWFHYLTTPSSTCSNSCLCKVWRYYGCFQSAGIADQNAQNV